jgi:TP901 family phage tail tape measure protein
MANLTSTLLLSLKNNFSGGAKTVERDAKSMDRTLRGIGKGGAARMLAGGGLTAMGGIAGTLGAVGGGLAARKAVVDAADWDRRITRILITADAASTRADEVRKKVRDVASGTGAQIPDIVEGLDSLVSSGRTLDESLTLLPSVAATAQAAGAATADIARTADALGTSFKIMPDRMQSAFDILVAGGKAGKFELKDMASELPSLAAAAAATGLKGEAGLRKLVAMLQTIRTQSGTSGEAATAMANVFQKMETEETANKFKKFGINLRKEMDKARKSGKDLIEVFLDLAVKAVKGDLSKLPQLFADAQFLQGARALLQMRDATAKLEGELKNVDGSTIRDLARVSGDAKAQLDGLSNSWAQFLISLGKTANFGGVTTSLKVLSDLLEKLSNGEYTDAAKIAAQYLSGVGDTPEKRAAFNKKKEEDAQVTALTAYAKKYQALKSAYEAERVKFNETVGQYNGVAEGPPGAGRDAVLGQLKQDLDARQKTMADIRAQMDGLKKAYDAAFGPYFNRQVGQPEWVDYAQPGIPSELMPPMPRPKPPKGERGVEAPKPVSLGTNVDEASVMAAADEIRRKAQAYVDRNPIVIPVRAGTVAGIGAAIGREVQSGLDGSYSDNSGRR